MNLHESLMSLTFLPIFLTAKAKPKLRNHKMNPLAATVNTIPPVVRQMVPLINELKTVKLKSHSL